MTTTPPVLDLGGGIRVHPGILTPELIPVDAVTPHPLNPRVGDTDAIGESVDENGLYDQIKVQRSTGRILSGNHTWLTLKQKGATRVPVVWLDVDDREALRVLTSANRTADRGAYDAKLLVEVLAGELAGDTTGTGYTPAEVDAMTAAADRDGDLYIGGDTLMAELIALADPENDETALGPVYTRRADSIRYEPTTPEPPPVESLVDRRKTAALQADINAAVAEQRIPLDVARFLLTGAERHLVFDYAAIAEFYAHAPPEVQRLMEASALVIVDFEDAIQHGFVRLSARLAELLDLDLAHRTRLDAQGGYRSDREGIPS